MARLYVVVPCYNEEEVLRETASRLAAKLRELAEAGRIAANSRVLFVNDGSKDRTWEIIAELHQEHPGLFSGLKLSRNRGHQNALLAGLMEAAKHADVIVSMDADLQDDINAMDRMLEAYEAGAEVVTTSSIKSTRLPSRRAERKAPCRARARCSRSADTCVVVSRTRASEVSSRGTGR